MNTHRTEATVQPDGKLLVEGVPFQPGAVVDVIIQERDNRTESAVNPYPLRGTAYSYQHPFEPIADSEWDALR